ncbi:MAG: SxtJ family membrane protein [Burkholderiales bacterium]|nr:SxtJ family membrane protein [Burkholderiales bacterium]
MGRDTNRQISGESLNRVEVGKPGSERNFGLVMAGFFALLAGIAAWRLAPIWTAGWAAVSLGFGATALLAPRVLAPLNLAWFRFGLLLHAVINPLIMGAMFFVVITPIGIIMRVLGKRPIPLRPDRAASSYWRSRCEQPGPMSKQY